jgi:hypothetical protein
MPLDDYTQSDVGVPTTPYRVFTKATYATEEWTAQPNVDLMSVVDGLNDVASIVLRYHSGKLLREKTSEYATVTPVDWIGTLVLVELYGRDEEGAPDYGVVKERWIGTIVIEDREFIGASTEGGIAYDQGLLARGLEDLLDQTIVTGSWIESRQLDGAGEEGALPIAVRIDTPMIFNAPRNGPVPWDKNCSAAVVNKWYAPGEEEPTDVPQNHGDGGSGPCVFAEIGDDTTTWMVGDVLDYLVCLYSPTLAEGVRFRTSTVDPDVEDAEDTLGTALYGLIVAPMSVEGRTLFDCLDMLLRKERGLGWRLVYDDDAKAGTKGPIIHVFSIQAEAVTIDEVEFPAAASPLELEVTGRRDVSWQTRRDVREEFGTIIVRGEQLLSCFSVSKADASLGKGWTTQEEAAYKAPPGIGVSTDADFILKRDRYRAQSRAWAEYVLEEGWNLKAGDGAGGYDEEALTPVNPVFTDAGDPDYGAQSSIAIFDKRFERFIPIELEKPEGAAPDAKPTYKQPIVFCKEPARSRWVDLGNNNQANCPNVHLFEPLEDRPGFRIRCDVNHSLAGREPEDGETGPNWRDPTAADWKEMILTAAMRTGTRLTMKASIEENDPLRILTIDVDRAEMWIILPGTVLSVKTDGTLERQGSTENLRDDRDRLMVVRDMAKAWYGQGRKPISLQFRSLTIEAQTGEDETTKLALGTFVDTIADGSAGEIDVKTVISRRAFDFVRNTAVYETGFNARPDFSSIA